MTSLTRRRLLAAAAALPVIPGFRYRGHQFADADGRYRLSPSSRPNIRAGHATFT